MFAPTILWIMFGNLAAAATLPWLARVVLDDAQMQLEQRDNKRGAPACARGLPQGEVRTAGAADSGPDGEMARQPLKYPGLQPSRKAA